MANQRDGGTVIIGVEDDGQTLTPVGLLDADLATWRYDDVADALAVYADPPVIFELNYLQHDGKTFVVLRVSEFHDIPVLCRKSYSDVLREGACYVRPRRIPETAEIPSHADMRDLLDLATAKRLRQYIEQAHTIGINLSSPALSTGATLFAEQRSGRTSDLLEKIRSRGYWEVAIHPGRFDHKRVTSLGHLYPLLQKTAVSRRGWDFPHLDAHQRTHRDIDWIGEETDFANRLESWRFYQSG
jgi:hypothetical protein